MAKEKREPSSDYYRLKTQAVDDLVSARKGNVPEVSEAELRRYVRKSRYRIPMWLKVLFVKFWFAGAVCYFCIWGLGLYIGDSLDLLAATSVIMGFVTDILTNNLLRFMEETPGENAKWMVIGKKRYVSLILNVVYAAVLMFCVAMIYSLIGTGIEPLFFGLLYLGCDMVFVGIKRFLMKIIADARRKVDEGGV